MKFNERVGAVLLAFLFGLMVLTGIGQGALAQAQVTGTNLMIVQPQQTTCFNPAYNLRYGASDWNTGGAVSQLQSFLTSQGFFSNMYLGSGRYGVITIRAVAQFQAAHGLPATGYFGPMTRALVQQLTCGTVVVPPTQSLTLYSVTPSAAAVGSSMSVTGFGFTSSNNILIDGMLAVRGALVTSSVAIACTNSPTCHGGINQTITFTLPSALSPNCPIGSYCALYINDLTPGVHTLSVQNENGTSNGIQFTVTGATNQPLSISGLSAPATLGIGQSGTWTVQVKARSATSNLYYSVVWGDEVAYGSASIMAPKMSTVQSSATFTHSYSRSGTYTPVFTVTDDSGASVSASNTLVVQPLY
jgi:peptidoglycan hydrolase-like protein with peptidoglycan-binding domain